ncbi:hypothetical protein HYT23_04055 [Candidatus Pacearchaeota archaeon]|nr:hypothetical protein [Candidatus Pacearchaeota archaeon]
MTFGRDLGIILENLYKGKKFCLKNGTNIFCFFKCKEVKMRKFLLSLFVVSFAVLGLVGASAPEKTDAFICPVFNSGAVGMHNPNAVPIADGDYTILGPYVVVPVHATNGNGAGNPGGIHSGPGDTDYTPIWNL